MRDRLRLVGRRAATVVPSGPVRSARPHHHDGLQRDAGGWTSVDNSTAGRRRGRQDGASILLRQQRDHKRQLCSQDLRQCRVSTSPRAAAALGLPIVPEAISAASAATVAATNAKRVLLRSTTSGRSLTTQPASGKTDEVIADYNGGAVRVPEPTGTPSSSCCPQGAGSRQGTQHQTTVPSLPPANRGDPRAVQLIR